MCSVLAIPGLDSSEPIPRERVLALSRLQRHRGPDWSGVYAHERAVLAVNGEIYNHRDLEAGLHRPTTSRPAATARSFQQSVDKPARAPRAARRRARIGEDYVLGIATDDMGIQYVRVYGLSRAPLR